MPFNRRGGQPRRLGGADAALRVETRQAVSAALAASGATALLVTHDQSEALAMGFQVAVLRSGVLAQIATPEILYRQPVDPAMARFVGESVVLPGTVSGAMATCALGRLPIANAPADGPADVMVRPEQIRLVSRQMAETTRAKVEIVAFYGRDASVVLALETRAETVTSRVPGHRAPRRGDEVWLSVDGAVMAYPRAAKDAALVDSVPPQIGRFSREPISASALGITEDLP